MLSDIEIAQQADIKPITDIAAKLDIPEDMLVPYGKYKAKVSLDFYQEVKQRKPGKLVLVTGVTPTAAGEGKSTVTVGLGDGLRLIGKKSVVCLREPSLGPCFGIKGGAAGGGYPPPATAAVDWVDATVATPSVMVNANTIQFPTSGGVWSGGAFFALGALEG